MQPVKPAPGTYFTLALFIVAHTLLAVDRAIMAILLEPIKAEFDLSDSELGLLGGLGFALFFGIAGIPLGRMVDRGNRRNILAACVAVFSSMTAATAFAGHYLHVLLCRMLVGAGEAGGGPAMVSMISDMFPPHKRATMVAFYYAGTPLGSMLIFVAGGYMAMHYDWRMVFLAAGLPGVFLALLLRYAIKEPQRRVDSGGAAEKGEALPFRKAVRFIWSQHALRHLVITSALTSAASAGVFAFAASLLIRSHGASLGQAGLVMGFVFGGMGLVGTIFGGMVVDRLARRDGRWRTWYLAVASALNVPVVIALAFSPTLGVAAVLIGLWSVLSVACYGPIMALMSTLAGSRMRGTVTALYYLASYVIGVGVGPQFVGLVSDLAAPSVGDDALRYGIGAAVIFYVWAVWHFLQAGRSVQQNLLRAAVV